MRLLQVSILLTPGGRPALVFFASSLGPRARVGLVRPIREGLSDPPNVCRGVEAAARNLDRGTRQLTPFEQVQQLPTGNADLLCNLTARVQISPHLAPPDRCWPATAFPASY